MKTSEYVAARRNNAEKLLLRMETEYRRAGKYHGAMRYCNWMGRLTGGVFIACKNEDTDNLKKAMKRLDREDKDILRNLLRGTIPDLYPIESGMPLLVTFYHDTAKEAVTLKEYSLGEKQAIAIWVKENIPDFRHFAARTAKENIAMLMQVDDRPVFTKEEIEAMKAVSTDANALSSYNPELRAFTERHKIDSARGFFHSVARKLGYKGRKRSDFLEEQYSVLNRIYKLYETREDGEKQKEHEATARVPGKPETKAARRQRHRKEIIDYLASIGIEASGNELPPRISADRIRRNYETAESSGGDAAKTVRRNWRMLAEPAYAFRERLKELEKEHQKPGENREIVYRRVMLTPESVVRSASEDMLARLREEGYEPEIVASIILRNRKFINKNRIPWGFIRRNSMPVDGGKLDRHIDELRRIGVLQEHNKGRTGSINPRLASIEGPAAEFALYIMNISKGAASE